MSQRKRRGTKTKSPSSGKKKSKSKSKTTTKDKNVKIKHTELAKGLLLNIISTTYKEAEGKPAKVKFEVENTLTQNAVLTFDFTQSDNIQINAENKKGKKVTATLTPFSKAIVATLIHDDVHKAWKYGWGASVAFKKADTSTLKKLASKDQDKITKELEPWKKLYHPGDEVEDIIRKGHEHSLSNFVDPEFPPCDASIGAKTLKELGYGVTWRRPCEFMPKGFKLFHRGVEPNDIRQGSLGNCWVMSSFSVLAERASRIKGIFLNNEANEFGCYQLVLFKNGKRQYVTVDDYFPCYPGAGPCFSKNRGNELWVLLLEKAYAKLNGGYERLKGGNANQALCDLTGCPAKEYDLGSEKIQADIKNGKFWPRMLKYATGDKGEDQNYLMAISTKPAGRSKAHKLKGLVPGHAYALLDCQTVKDKKGHERQLMQLRNPWGKFEWNGRWSDKSSEWTDAIKKQLNWSDKDDGLFWMELPDVMQYFGSMSICRLMERWPGRQWEVQFKAFELHNKKSHKSKTGESSDEEDGELDPKLYEGIKFRPKKIFHLDVKKGAGTVNVIASLHQEDPRIEASNALTDIAVYIAEVRYEDTDGDGEVEIVGLDTLVLGGPKVNREVFCKEITLKEGRSYYVIPVSWGTRVSKAVMEKKTFAFGLRWSEKGKLRLVTQKCYNSTLLLLQQMKVDRAMDKGTATVLAKPNKDRGPISAFVLKEGNMMMCVLENKTKEGFSVKPNLTFKTRNCISGRQDGKFTVNDRLVKYGERELVMEVIQKDEGAWSAGFGGGFKLVKD